MGNLFTMRVGNILTMLLGNVLTARVGKVLDIYSMKCWIWEAARGGLRDGGYANAGRGSRSLTWTELRPSLLGQMVKSFFGDSAKNGFPAFKGLKLSRMAGRQCTFKRPIYCPNNGVYLTMSWPLSPITLPLYFLQHHSCF